MRDRSLVAKERPVTLDSRIEGKKKNKIWENGKKFLFRPSTVKDRRGFANLKQIACERKFKFQPSPKGGTFRETWKQIWSFDVLLLGIMEFSIVKCCLAHWLVFVYLSLWYTVLDGRLLSVYRTCPFWKRPEANPRRFLSHLHFCVCTPPEGPICFQPNIFCWWSCWYFSVCRNLQLFKIGVDQMSGICFDNRTDCCILAGNVNSKRIINIVSKAFRGFFQAYSIRNSNWYQILHLIE